MIDRATKLRWRRRVRLGRVAVEDFSVNTEERLEKHLFKRLTRIYGVRRFIASWLMLMALLATGLVLQTRSLSGYYQSLQPVPGGTYTEGIIGSFTNANPLYASGGVDRAAARLLFSGLLTYDQNNQLVGDLATGWTLDPTELVYTFKLRQDVKWHDGKPFTAADVVFTYATIKNPDAKSPLQTSWTGIEVEQPDDYTVVFRLPSTLSAFPYAATNGIVPKHLLEKVPVNQLRSTNFNTLEPVGTGPFKWDVIEVVGTDADTRQQLLGMTANDAYYKGAPKLNRLIIRTFRDETQLIDNFLERKVDAMLGLNSLPDTISSLQGVENYSIPLTGEVLVFFNNSQEILADAKVRQALVKAADTKAIIASLDHHVIPADSPLLKKHLGYDPNITQFPTNKAEAGALLDAAGWVMGPDGIRLKGDKRLELKLKAQANSVYSKVTQMLQAQWLEVGIDFEPRLLEETEFQDAVAIRAAMPD